MSLQLSEAVLAREVALIGERIAALPSRATVGAQAAEQLRVIAASLREVAEDNPGVAAHLRTLLGSDSMQHR